MTCAAPVMRQLLLVFLAMATQAAAQHHASLLKIANSWKTHRGDTAFAAYFGTPPKEATANTEDYSATQEGEEALPSVTRSWLDGKARPLQAREQLLQDSESAGDETFVGFAADLSDRDAAEKEAQENAEAFKKVKQMRRQRRLRASRAKKQAEEQDEYDQDDKDIRAALQTLHSGAREATSLPKEQENEEVLPEPKHGRTTALEQVEEQNGSEMASARSELEAADEDARLLQAAMARAKAQNAAAKKVEEAEAEQARRAEMVKRVEDIFSNKKKEAAKKTLLLSEGQKRAEEADAAMDAYTSNIERKWARQKAAKAEEAAEEAEQKREKQATIAQAEVDRVRTERLSLSMSGVDQNMVDGLSMNGVEEASEAARRAKAAKEASAKAEQEAAEASAEETSSFWRNLAATGRAVAEERGIHSSF